MNILTSCVYSDKFTIVGKYFGGLSPPFQNFGGALAPLAPTLSRHCTTSYQQPLNCFHSVKDSHYQNFESKHKSLTELSTDAKASRYERLLAIYEKERSSLVVSANFGISNRLLHIHKDNLPKNVPAEDFTEFGRLLDPDFQYHS